MSQFAVVGTDLPRIEGHEKVTGKARYSGDVRLPGLVYGKILRSAVPHARLLGVDTSRVRALPGVQAVLTGADLGGIRMGNVVRDLPVLCDDRVRFVGDAIAAVAADTPEIAEEAVDLIDVQYEELPVVSSPIEAMAESVPLLHPDFDSYQGAVQLPAIHNLQGYNSARKGDVEKGFAEADLVFEHSFTTSLAHQGYLESRSCVVSVSGDGTVDVWSSCKVPYRMRDLLAELFGLEKPKVVVQRANIGGDFGGKGAIGPEPVAYYLAKACGRPVMIVPTYVEEFMAGNPRHPAWITVRTGVLRDGTIVARQMTVTMDGGAYGAHKITPKLDLPSVMRGLGPYRIPNTLIEARWVYTNNVPGGIARAPGQPQVIFAGESQIDMIAEALGLDPIELRLRNVIQDGDVWPAGERFEGVMARETLLLAREVSGWDSPVGPKRGRGVAITERGIPAAPSGVVVTAYDDGRVTVLSAVPDVGTGAFTILKQIIAEELHLPLDVIRVVTGDTNHAPLDAGIGGSKSTFSMTAAAVEATAQLNARALELASERLECAPEDIEIVQGGYQVKGYPDSRIAATDLLVETARRAGGHAEARSPGPGQKRAVQSCSVACVAEVEVDPETGTVTPLKLTMAHDVGQPINPQLLQAQIEGSTIQGLGMALMEEIATEQGRISTLNLGDYKLPTPLDIPELISVLVPGAPGPSPYGAKAVGELGNCPVPAAMANAIARAVGARVTALPLTAERIRRALRRGLGAGT